MRHGRLRNLRGPLIACYERFLADGSLDVRDLDDALVSLRVAPAFEGALVERWPWSSAGGAGAPSKDTVAAPLELLTTTGLRPAPVASVPLGSSTNKPARKNDRRATQPPLPGPG